MRVLRRTNRSWWCAWLCLMLLGSAAHAQVGRLIEDVDVVETPARYDLTVRFACNVRYVSHAPNEQGVELRVHLSLGGDCGLSNVSSEALVSPAPAVVRTIELSPLVADDVELLIRWRLAQQFLVVPSNDQRGLRIRILRAGEGAKSSGRVLVDEPHPGDITTAYAINLESALKTFDDAELQQAQSRFGVRAYLSEIDIDNTHWYRLRLGPIATKADADALLLVAQKTYPRAWLAIADENVDQQDLADVPEPASSAPEVDNKISDALADELWAQANERFRHKDYARAIELFTKLHARPSRKYRAESQELLGLAHERMGELAHAQAEYEAFLREFPSDRHTARVRRRLNALRTATLPGRTASGEGSSDEGTWKWLGGISQYYRRDDSQLSIANTTQSATTQNALLSDFDLTARYRSFDTDTRIRVSAGYIKDFLSTGLGDQLHVSSAFVELSDRDRGWYGSLGRQSRAGSGLFGRFDGLLGSYQWHPHFVTDLTIGSPVDSARSGFDSHRVFETLSFNFGIFFSAFEPSIYFANQKLDGETDRRAVGTELRYFKPGRVFIGFADYDIFFKTLNTAVLIGTVQLPARWTVNIDLEQRKTPLITTRNALIGQPVRTLQGLSSAFNDDQIRQLALDRTPDTRLYSVTAAKSIGERLQLTLTAQSIETGASPPSEGSTVDFEFPPVDGIPATGREVIASIQLFAASIMRSGDISIIGLRRQSGGVIETNSLGLSSRVPIWAGLLFGPQLRVDQRQYQIDDSTLWLYAPSLRLTLNKRTFQLDVEAGSEISKRNTQPMKQDSTRYFYNLGYRWQF